MHAASTVLITIFAVLTAAAAVPLKISIALSIGKEGITVCFTPGLFYGAVKFRFRRRIFIGSDNRLILLKGKNLNRSAELFKKRDKRKSKSSVLKPLLSHSLSPEEGFACIKLLGAEGRIGSADRADIAVLAAGVVRTAFMAAFCLLPEAERCCFITTEYSRNVFALNVLCIARFDMGKFIIKALKAKRRTIA